MPTRTIMILDVKENDIYIKQVTIHTNYGLFNYAYVGKSPLFLGKGDSIHLIAKRNKKSKTEHSNPNMAVEQFKFSNKDKAKRSYGKHMDVNLAQRGRKRKEQTEGMML